MVFYYLYFIIYSFMGWCMESTIYTFKKHRFVNRGFLNGPLCPIYGTGMVVIILSLQRFENNIILLFIFGMILATCLEYLTGYFLEKTFHTKWWDYSHKKFNIHGYICLQDSLAWGVLCVVMLTFVQPFIERIINSFSSNVILTFTYVTLFILVIDVIVTLTNMISLRQVISHLHNAKEDIYQKAHLSERLNELEKRLQTNQISLKEYVDHLKEYVHNRHLKPLDKIESFAKRRNLQLNRLLKNYNVKAVEDKQESTDIIKSIIKK